VWRNEKPGPGRFREFWQCDADTVGAPGPEADAEMIAMACAALEAAGVARGSYRLKFSTRRLLDAVLEAAGVAGDPVKSLRVLRAIDKLDRLGREGVGLLLGAGRRDESGDFTPGAELDEGQRAIVLGVFGSEPSAAQAAPRSDAIGQMVQRIGDRSAKFEGAIAEFVAIDAILGRLGVSQVQAAIDPSIVRGLEYYTGPVFEAELLAETVDENGNKIRFGSVGGGGRYDDLVSRFRGEKIPATGFSIGVSRLAAALAAGERGENAQAQGPVVVLPFDKEGMAECFALAASVRAAGMAAEVYLGGSGPKAQLRYADKRNAPAAVILGGDERAAGQVTIKDLKLGAALSKQVADNREWREGRQAQVTVAQADMIPTLQRMLQP
jgi:histidyl-tRNA synthetase